MLNSTRSQVLLTVPPLCGSGLKEFYTQMLFETFNVPGVFIISQASAVLLSEGKSTGVAVISGANNTVVCPVYAEHAIEWAAQRCDVAGQDITSVLQQKLTDNGYSFTTTAEREIVRDVKEKLCFVSLDYEKDLEKTKINSELEKSYELPDGQVMTFSAPRFVCAEALFDPKLAGFPETSLGIAQCVHEAIKAAAAPDPGLLSHFYSNIILSGGNTMFPGFAERLTKEVQALAPADQVGKVRVTAPAERKYTGWISGSMVSQRINQMYVSKEEYDESGPKLANWKFLW